MSSTYKLVQTLVKSNLNKNLHSMLFAEYIGMNMQLKQIIN